MSLTCKALVALPLWTMNIVPVSEHPHEEVCKTFYVSPRPLLNPIYLFFLSCPSVLQYFRCCSQVSKLVSILWKTIIRMQDNQRCYGDGPYLKARWMGTLNPSMTYCTKPLRHGFKGIWEAVFSILYHSSIAWYQPSCVH